MDNGAIAILIRLGKFDDSEIPFETMRRLDKHLDDIRILDERKQIGGFIMIFDFTGVSTHQAKLSFGPKSSKLEGQYHQVS